MNNVNYGKITGALLAAWFVFSLSASALNVFKTDPSEPPIALGLAALIPIVLFSLWFAVSEGFRRFAMSLNPRTLTFIQAWRVAGYVFLVLQTYSILPAVFALPAGWGDIAVGATAPLAALMFANPGRRRSFILWQALGIADLVTAVTLGTTARLLSPQGPATAPMNVLPLSLIPTFGVPLFLILHIICIAQARRWHDGQIWAVRESAAPSHSY